MAKKSKKPKHELKFLPLFIVTEVIVFSLIFTVILVPILSTNANIGFYFVFIMLLVIVATVSAGVSIIFYMILKGEKVIK